MRRARRAGRERLLLEPEDRAGQAGGRAHLRRASTRARRGPRRSARARSCPSRSPRSRRPAAATPGNAWCATAPPSSRTNQGRTPRRTSSSTAVGAAGAEDLLVAAEREPDVLGGGEAVARAGARRPRRCRPGSPCRRGCRGPRSRRRRCRRRTAGAARARPRRRGRRRGGPSARPAGRRRDPRQWKSRPWVWTRVSSRRSCSSGNCRSSSARNASKASVSTRAGSRFETVGMRTSACSFATARSVMAGR